MVGTDTLEADALACIEYLERELGAALKDIKSLCASNWYTDYCDFCKYQELGGQCYHDCMTEPGGLRWEWRGVQE